MREGENLNTCLHDCGICEIDGTCNPTTENPYSCPQDCPATACDSDGEIDALSEQCDNGNTNNDNNACTSTCEMNVCGDGHPYVGVEECDDGNMDNTDACVDTCKTATCGDSFTQAGVEECDDGNMDNTDACVGTCMTATCGDSFTQAGVEECDDGNMTNNDGCSPECMVDRVVFVSSVSYQGNMTGLTGADHRCAGLALTAGLPGTFMAWLSDGSTGPATRFGLNGNFSGPFELVDGTLVAQGWADLTDGSLLHAIDRDEYGNYKSTTVWTNTAKSGALASTNHCNGWMSATFGDKGLVGNSDAKDGTWTDSKTVIPCNNSNSLYCIQVQ